MILNLNVDNVMVWIVDWGLQCAASMLLGHPEKIFIEYSDSLTLQKYLKVFFLDLVWNFDESFKNFWT